MSHSNAKEDGDPPGHVLKFGHLRHHLHVRLENREHPSLMLASRHCRLGIQCIHTTI